MRLLRGARVHLVAPPARGGNPMSLEMLSAVWDLDLTKNEQDVMEVLAWHSNADGVCWPSKARIMHTKKLSESTVKRTLKSLKDKGLLSVEAHADGGRGRTPLYRLHPEKGARKTPFKEFAAALRKRKKEGQAEPLSDDKGGQRDTERGSGGTGKGVRAATPEPTRNRQHEPSDSEENPDGSSSGDRRGVSAAAGPPEQEEAKPLSYRAYAFRRFRELIKDARDGDAEVDPLPDQRLGEYSAFYEQHAKEGADPDDLDDAIRWLVAKASGAIEGEAQAWAYFGTAVRAVRNGGVRKPFSVIEGGRTGEAGRGVGDGADGRDPGRYTDGYEFLFNRG